MGGSLGNAIGGAINTLGSLASGPLGALGGLGGAGGAGGAGGIGGLLNGLMSGSPDLGMLGGLAGSLGGLLGKAGGFSPGQAGGSPSPFGLGNLLPGIAQNPVGGLAGLFGGLTGGGAAGGAAGGGAAGGGAAAGGAAGGGGATGAGGLPDAGSFLSSMQSQMQDSLAFQQQMSSIQEAFAKASATVKAAHDMAMQMIQASA